VGTNRSKVGRVPKKPGRRKKGSKKRRAMNRRGKKK